MSAMYIHTLAPWFGGNRTFAGKIGQRLGQLRFCVVPFAGGMAELPAIDTKDGLAVDQHRHIINLARVVRDKALLRQLVRRLEVQIFHTDELKAAQARCVDRNIAREGALFGALQHARDVVLVDLDVHEGSLFGATPQRPDDRPGDAGDAPDVGWAADYFVAAWMGRGGACGRPGELAQSLAVRYSATGGSSPLRWRSAVRSLPAWQEVLERWAFVAGDAFETLARLEPAKGPYGIYCDPPWVDAGDEYIFRFNDEHHHRLAKLLNSATLYGSWRIVLRYGDDSLIRGLYPADRWQWTESTTRNQRGGDVAEVLICNPLCEPAEEEEP
jgi:DNA adenine methylase